MTIIRSLFTLLGFKVDDSGAEDYEKRLSSLKGAVVKLGEAFLLFKGAERISDAVKEFAAFSNATVDSATKLGTTTTAMQELGYAAQLGGSSAEAMKDALNTLGAASSGVTAKGKAVVQMLAGIGINTRDAGGHLKRSDQLFEELAVKLSSIQDPGKRAAIAMRVLGSAGESLLPLLASGKDGIAKLRQEAEDLGIVFEEDVIASAADLNNQFDRLRAVSLSMWRTIAAGLVPSIQRITARMLDWYKANQAFITGQINGVAKDLGAILERVGSAVGFVVDHFRNLIDGFGGLRNFFLVVGAGFAIVNASMIPTLLTAALVAAGFALIAAVIEDVALFEKYGDAADTLTGRLKKAFVDEPIKPDDVWFVVVLKVALKSVEKLHQAFLGLVEVAAYAFTAIQGIEGGGDALKKIVGDKLIGAVGVDPASLRARLAPQETPVFPFAPGPVGPQYIPPLRSPVSQTSVNDNRTLNFNIDGAGSPEATGAEVARQFDATNHVIVRE